MHQQPAPSGSETLNAWIPAVSGDTDPLASAQKFHDMFFFFFSFKSLSVRGSRPAASRSSLLGQKIVLVWIWIIDFLKWCVCPQKCKLIHNQQCHTRTSLTSSLQLITQSVRLILSALFVLTAERRAKQEERLKHAPSVRLLDHTHILIRYTVRLNIFATQRPSML